MSHRSHLARRLLTVAMAAAASLFAVAAGAHPCHIGKPLWHVHSPDSAEAADNYATRTSLVGVWRPAPGAADAPVYGLAGADAVVAKLNEMAAKNQMVDDFERYRAGGKILFALTFAPGNIPQQFFGSLNDAELNGKFAQLGPGWRLLDLETFGQGGGRRWAALFRQSGESEWELRLSLSAAQLVAETETAKPEQSLYLADFELLTPNSAGSAFAAVFAAGKKTQRLFLSLSAAEFHDKYHNEMAPAGYYLEDVETDWVGDEPRFAALFTKGEKPDHLFVDSCTEDCSSEDDFTEVWKELLASRDKIAETSSGLRLVDLEIPFGSPVALNDELALKNKSKTKKRSPRGGGGKNGRDRTGVLTNPTCPTGTHAGVLHDGGANVPIFP